MKLIDVHTHLEMLENAPDETIKIAQAAGIERMITIGCHPKDNQKVLEIAAKFFPVVSCTLGVHPHEAILYSDAVEKEIESHLHEPWVMGVGEIGLDYHYGHSPKDVQLDAFRKQMELASRNNLPVQIHTRDAEQDTVIILNEFKGRVRGMLHCFTGTQWLADEALNLGYNISFSGIVTFKTAADLRAVAKTVPLDRFHVETDAPFLTPVPFRGKENAPALLVHTAKLIAEIKNLSEAELGTQVLKNAKALFPKLELT